jgi:hypothetical protein
MLSDSEAWKWVEEKWDFMNDEEQNVWLGLSMDG